ncbi:eukaryotic translation initiation factor 5B-like [Ambystoma mexicanum]|uniref:eukaryotic translation initiation factor 5B-like n=1 Tax=Ambystoma mexicanum TaxID=8296 RepID=UPI0037E8AC94
MTQTTPSNQVENKYPVKPGRTEEENVLMVTTLSGILAHFMKLYEDIADTLRDHSTILAMVHTKTIFVEWFISAIQNNVDNSTANVTQLLHDIIEPILKDRKLGRSNPRGKDSTSKEPGTVTVQGVTAVTENPNNTGTNEQENKGGSPPVLLARQHENREIQSETATRTLAVHSEEPVEAKQSEDRIPVTEEITCKGLVRKDPKSQPNVSGSVKESVKSSEIVARERSVNGTACEGQNNMRQTQEETTGQITTTGIEDPNNMDKCREKEKKNGNVCEIFKKRDINTGDKKQESQTKLKKNRTAESKSGGHQKNSVTTKKQKNQPPSKTPSSSKCRAFIKNLTTPKEQPSIIDQLINNKKKVRLEQKTEELVIPETGDDECSEDDLMDLSTYTVSDDEENQGTRAHVEANTEADESMREENTDYSESDTSTTMVTLTEKEKRRESGRTTNTYTQKEQLRKTMDKRDRVQKSEHRVQGRNSGSLENLKIGNRWDRERRNSNKRPEMEDRREQLNTKEVEKELQHRPAHKTRDVDTYKQPGLVLERILHYEDGLILNRTNVIRLLHHIPALRLITTDDLAIVEFVDEDRADKVILHTSSNLVRQLLLEEAPQLRPMGFDLQESDKILKTQERVKKHSVRQINKKDKDFSSFRTNCVTSEKSGNQSTRSSNNRTKKQGEENETARWKWLKNLIDDKMNTQ